MRNIPILILFFLFLSCDNQQNENKKKLIENETETISMLLNQWHKSAAEANFDAYFEKMSSDSYFIGTDVKENWNIAKFKEFSKPFFDNGKAWSFKSIQRNIYFNESNNTAWFDELLDTWMGVCRGSGVLEKNNGKWEIKQYVLSLTIPNENINEIIEINKVKDSLFLSKFRN